MRDEQELRIDANDVKDPHGKPNDPPRKTYDWLKEVYEEAEAHFYNQLVKRHGKAGFDTDLPHRMTREWIAKSIDDISQERGEAAWESFVEAYYGGDLPKETYEQRWNQLKLKE